MNKIIILGAFIFIFLGLLFLNNYKSDFFSNEIKNVESKYQGPVPEGFNLNHFRETGETILEVNNGG